MLKQILKDMYKLGLTEDRIAGPKEAAKDNILESKSERIKNILYPQKDL